MEEKKKRSKLLPIFLIAGVVIIISLGLVIYFSCFRSGDDNVLPNAKTFTVTFETNGGSAVKSQNISEGGRVTKPQDPTKEYYIFDGWSYSESSNEEYNFSSRPSGSFTLYAFWRLDLNSDNVYKISWTVDGVGILTKYALIGEEPPVYDGLTPNRESSAQYDYHFASWDSVTSSITNDITYTAVFSRTLRSYQITFNNYNNTLLETQSFPYGSLPFYTGFDPVKTGNDEFDYIFTSWDPVITEVSGNATYTAVFEPSVKSYLIKFLNYDNTVLQSGLVPYGSVPVYEGETPTRPSDQQYSYTFSGWNNQIVNVTFTTTYTATYSNTLNQYEVTFRDFDNTFLDSKFVDYGSSVVPPLEPDSMGDYFYFSSWSQPLTNITDTITIIAQYHYVFGYEAIENQVSIFSYHNKGLLDVVVPSSIEGLPVTKILSNTFNTSSPITQIYVPLSITNIEKGSFRGLRYLESITLPFIGSNPNDLATSYFSYIYNANDGLTGGNVVPGSLKNVTILGGTVIGDYAFYACMNIESIVIPSSILTIGDHAFDFCIGLKNLNSEFDGDFIVPSSVLDIGFSAFGNSSYIEKITLPFIGKNTTTSDNSHFGYIFGAENFMGNQGFTPSSISTVIIKGGTVVYENAFLGCENIEKIVLPLTITEIQNNAFNGCNSLDYLVI
ncbi:MAG: leucine-rich repeat protein, partial [Acholeplasmatales bacterium]|nr:leucine-rich repeat protein [Acholeplasmatales bacterium]